jgi:acetyltransferase
MNTDSEVRAYCNFTFTRLIPGHISVFAQSGGVGEVVHNRLFELEAGVRMYASPGNSCDVAVPEILKYWGDDPETRVIICHVESLADPRGFFEVAREVAAKKPILGMKTGRTKAGAKAVSSHTGGLMKQDTTTELIFAEAGVISISDQEELCQAALAFARQPAPRGNRVGVITNTGGPGIICTDEVIAAGCEIPDLAPATQQKLREALYDEAIVANPVDVIATAGPEHWKAAVEGLIQDPGIDSILLNFITPFFVDCEGVAKEIAALAPTAGKPIIGIVMTEKAGWKTTLETFRGAGIPTYDFPETGARALAAMSRYAVRSARPAGAPERPAGVDRDRAAAIINASAESGRSFVPQALAFQVLAAYGIGTPRTEGVTDLDGVKAAAAEIGYPVVLKVDSEDVVHKSDAGGVALNLTDAGALEAAFARMNDAFGDNGPAYLVSQFVSGDREVILGAKREPGLGHVLVFGLGGIMVEVLRDAAFALAPVSHARALEAIRSIKGFKVLQGVRGQAPADVDLLADALVRLGWLVSDNPSIEELDLNPVFAFEQGRAPIAVDVRIKIGG